MTLIPNDVVKKHSIEGLSLLRAWREHLRITQQEMGERLGISQAAVAQQEAPDSQPQLATLQKWADALGLSLAQVTLD